MSNNKQSSVDKEFVPYEEALALKELGFNEPCLASYYRAGKRLDICEYINHGEYTVLAPTLSQAFRWFRKKYDLPSNLELFHVGWDYVIYLNITEEIDFNEGPWNTYEEAELACLRKLIEIVQGGNNEQQ